MVNDREQIIRVFSDDPKNISGMELAEGELFGIRFPIAISELLPI
jgi:hypothetical protein